ncbi:DNA polymerase, partial [Paramuricea clavata]
VFRLVRVLLQCLGYGSRWNTCTRTIDIIGGYKFYAYEQHEKTLVITKCRRLYIVNARSMWRCDKKPRGAGEGVRTIICYDDKFKDADEDDYMYWFVKCRQRRKVLFLRTAKSFFPNTPPGTAYFATPSPYKIWVQKLYEQICTRHIESDELALKKWSNINVVNIIVSNEMSTVLYFYDLETRVNEQKMMENFIPHPTLKHCDSSVEPVSCCGHRHVWIAHNGGRFDNIFLLRELLVKRNIVPHTIMNGNKIMCIEIQQDDNLIKIIDSYLFLAMPLSKIPETMGIPDLTKGYHPHFFTDLNYVGPMVGLEYFDLSRESDLTEFNKWYKIQTTKTYDTIGQIPPTGYGGNVNQSIIALHWLCEIQQDLEKQGHSLRSKLSPEGEENILNYFVDGYCPETNTIYQFHGCFFHGCSNCFEGGDINKVNGQRFYVLREKTRRITNLFEDYRFNVVERWECEHVQACTLSRTTILEMGHVDFFAYINLNPRDALFGGRTSPAKLYHEVTTDEKLRYYDFTSLYPHVQKKYRYPTKHPEITRGVDKCAKLNIDKIFGLIKCKILAPLCMLFPVLPLRLEKLMFALCTACAREQCTKCTHNDEQRALYGTWTSVEIHRALEHGYKILIIYEVYHYPHSAKIFDLYVDTFMKLKQESSGLPQLVNDKTVEVTSLDFISDDIARTTHRKVGGSLTTLGNRNVIIASFVTAYARLELFEVLNKLQENVLYYDTDSVIYSENRAQGKYLETSKYLGDLTDELSEKNCTEKWIVEFCAAGPKSYSYRKMRGSCYDRSTDATFRSLIHDCFQRRFGGAVFSGANRFEKVNEPRYLNTAAGISPITVNVFDEDLEYIYLRIRSPKEFCMMLVPYEYPVQNVAPGCLLFCSKHTTTPQEIGIVPTTGGIKIKMVK